MGLEMHNDRALSNYGALGGNIRYVHLSTNHAISTKNYVSAKKKQDEPSLAESRIFTTVLTASSTKTTSCERSTPLTPSQQRTIFPEYWRKDGKRSLAMSTPSTNRRISPSHPVEKCANKEPVNKLVNNEQEPSDSKKIRRNIFGNSISRTENKLTRSLTVAICTPLTRSGVPFFRTVRKTSSTSALLPGENQKPCLRPVQVYSSPDFTRGPSDRSNRRPTLRSSDSSVSFSPEIDVFEFDRHHERTDGKTWTDIFS